MEWRTIKGSNGQYEVSDTGIVRNAWTGKELKQIIRKDGRPCVTLCGMISDKRLVSRLVADAFLQEGGRAYHKNGDKTDNRAENIEVR